jgi:hypothetical protein
VVQKKAVDGRHRHGSPIVCFGLRNFFLWARALFSNNLSMSNDPIEPAAPTKHKKPTRDQRKLSNPGVEAEPTKTKRKKHSANGLLLHIF